MKTTTPETRHAAKPWKRDYNATLDAIKALRHEHSRRFMAQEWQSMQTIGDKIRLAWKDYEFARRCAFEKRVCFNCKAKPVESFTVEAPGKYPMLFCSAECRMEFGVSLSLT